MKIIALKNTETIMYAAEELKKYLEMMDSSLQAEITLDCKTEGITLGLLSDLGLDASDVNDDMIDDVVDINIDSLGGYIAGSNERSVLFGVYKYLKGAGCRWVRPGELGEYIPKRKMLSYSFCYRKKADYPFRGQAIEGAVSFEHLRETILWLPKVDMNLFQIEQIVPYNYMSRWYIHKSNTVLSHVDIPYQNYCNFCAELEHLVKKCGLQLHALGHGALNEPFGIRHMVAGQQYNVSEETKRAFALVDGKRELYESAPFYTQLCMSQEWVQEKVVNWLVDYLKQKPHIDFLHFWLADAFNNHCECEDCIKKTPSDWYVQMLNKLDSRLSKENIKSKIVFIMYVDTLWPPIVEKLNNPSRFIMTTACGSGKGYSAKRREGGIPPWKRNDFSIEGGLDMALTFKDAWKCVFDGTSFVYEYMFYTDHYADPGYMTFARRVAKDVKELKVTGFEGIMSDQTQRCYFPTALPVSVFGEFLFDSSLDIEKYIEKYMQDSFGEDYNSAKEYLEAVSFSFDPEAMKQNTDVTAFDTGMKDKKAKKAGIIGNEALGRVIDGIPKLVDMFAETVERNLVLNDKCHSESWRILKYHGEYCKGVSNIYVALSRNDTDRATEALKELIDYLSKVELDIQLYFDLFLFNRRTEQIIAGK